MYLCLSLAVALLSFSAVVEALSHWGIVSNGVATASAKNRCSLKCHKASYGAVINPQGDCSCDSFVYNPLNTVMYYVGKTTLPLRAWMFLPLTSAPLANSFRSFGTDNVEVTIHGNPMVFDRDGPPGHLHGKKALHLRTSAQDYLEYTLPDSLLAKVADQGYIMSFWMKSRATLPMTIIQFSAQNNLRVHLSMLNKFVLKLDQDHKLPENSDGISMDTNWHHYALIVERSPTMGPTFGMAYLRIDGVQHADGLTAIGDITQSITSKLYLGYPIEMGFAPTDVFFYCFILQELEPANDLDKTIEETKNACDFF